VTERIARAADRIQALLGHHAIIRPVPLLGRQQRQYPSEVDLVLRAGVLAL